MVVPVLTALLEAQMRVRFHKSVVYMQDMIEMI